MASDRKRVARTFKSRGLTIQSTALDALLNVLSRETHDETLFAIIDEVKDRLITGGGPGGNVVTTSLLEEVVAELSRDAKDVTDEAVQLLDAFQTPRLEFDAMRKQFRLLDDSKEKRSLYGKATDKVGVPFCVFSSKIGHFWAGCLKISARLGGEPSFRLTCLRSDTH